MKLEPNLELTKDKIEQIREYFDGPMRNATLATLDKVIASRKSRGGVIKLYLENFKEFNDTFGYRNGGELIKEIAIFLCKFPEIDVYRYRGVEFILVLDECSHAVILDIAQEIVERFEYSWTIGNIDCMCSVSLGIAYYPGHAKTVEEMLENLSNATYEATKAGRNQIVLYNEDLKMRLYRRNAIANLIPSLIESKHIEIRFRPILRMSTGIFTSAECSVRLLTDEFGIVNAGEFIPIAEETGQIRAVTRYLIEGACKAASNLLWAGVDFDSIIIPVSPIQFLQEPFVAEVAEILLASGIPARYLSFQVTESMIISSFSYVQMRMFDLADLGIRILLDEFGSGYSDMNHILTLPVNAVKLERMFIWQLETNPRSAPLINGLIQIAKRLEFDVIADVETENQAKLLQEYGCDYQQGFYHTPYIPEKELPDVLGKNRAELDLTKLYDRI